MAYIEWLHRPHLSRDHVGGKGASLSELMAAGFAVPAGFCITAGGYRAYAESTGIDERIAGLLAEADGAGPSAVVEAARRATRLIEETPLPEAMREEIASAYDGLVAMGGLACAVRSSAIAEDGAGASFAGLYESYLNVRGVAALLEAVRRCYGSLWSERAFAYRARNGGGQDEAMAVVVMALVPSETSGVAFTAHPVSGDRDLVVINASWGLGEAIVSGVVTPDSFVVRKGTLALVEREIYPKQTAIYPHPDGGGTIQKQLPKDKAAAPSLSDAMACEVARLAAKVEAHYGSPQDVEWGIAGGQVFLLQSRPITTLF